MKKISNTQAAYIAGFFDGEGCVHSTSVSPKSGLTRVRITITQRQISILEWIQRILGYGEISKVKRGSFNFRITGQPKVRQFIKLVLPYSRVKKSQLLVGLQLSNLIGSRRIKVSDPKIRQKREKLALKLKELKREHR